jgi:hypothetical protein
VHKVLHWYNGHFRYSLNPNGSGMTASERRIDWFETSVYTIPGNDTMGVDVTFSGLQGEIDLDTPGRPLLALNQGVIHFAPSGGFNIVSGRWDFYTDPDGTLKRVCSALEGKN